MEKSGVVVYKWSRVRRCLTKERVDGETKDLRHHSVLLDLCLACRDSSARLRLDTETATCNCLDFL